jgi:hypothetical protein
MTSRPDTALSTGLGTAADPLPGVSRTPVREMITMQGGVFGAVADSTAFLVALDPSVAS